MAVKILVDPEHAAVTARRAAEKRRLHQLDERRATMGELRTEFLTLVRQDAGTLAQRQRRGYDLEKLVTRLFRAYDMDDRPSYRLDHEQIDRSFHFRGFTYLVEAEWRAAPPNLGDVFDFKGKVDGNSTAPAAPLSPWLATTLLTTMAASPDPKPDGTYRAPVGSRDQCLPWHAEVVVVEGNVLVREWHAVGCPQFQELIRE